VSEDELYSFYKNTSLFIYPSLSEGFGIPPIEAISSGAKTICSNATALGDFDFLSDYHFSPNNLQELKAKITLTLEDENYPITQFQETITKRYDWNKIGDKLKLLLQSDLNK